MIPRLTDFRGNTIKVSFIMAVICRVCHNWGMGDHVVRGEREGSVVFSLELLLWIDNTVHYHFGFYQVRIYVVYKSFPHYMSQMVLLSVLVWSHPRPVLKSLAEICSKREKTVNQKGFIEPALKQAAILYDVDARLQS